MKQFKIFFRSASEHDNSQEVIRAFLCEAKDALAAKFTFAAAVNQQYAERMSYDKIDQLIVAVFENGGVDVDDCAPLALEGNDSGEDVRVQPEQLRDQQEQAGTNV